MSKQKTLGSSLERRVVERAKAAGLEAAKQPGSGVFADFPHDVVIEQLLVECKVRSASINARGEKQLTISLDWLRGVQAAAEKAGFEAGIVVVNPKGSSKPVVLCDFDFLLALLQKDLDRSANA